MLVSYEAQGNGVSVVIHKGHDADRPGERVPPRTTRQLHGLRAECRRQGAVNETDIRTYLPGAYVGTIPDERFGETALNLGQIRARVR